ncbi:MAG: phosphotransferase enzyme family protein [Chitinophagaceae bacterium]
MFNFGQQAPVAYSCINTLVPAGIPESFLSAHFRIENIDPEKIIIDQTGQGLINRSFRVRYDLTADFFLQQLNLHVFPNPRAIQENYLQLRSAGGIRMPAPLFCEPGETLCYDNRGGCWRAYEFIPNASTFSLASSPTLARSTAQAFARFTTAFEKFDTALLHEVIPGFHDLGLRYQQFLDSLEKGLPGRLEQTTSLSRELISRNHYAGFYDEFTRSPGFPKRVMHHDAKIGNIMFRADTGLVICPVDYDTVMPGYFFSDLGDMIRSMAGDQAEDSLNTDPVKIRTEYYEAILDGYTGVIGDQLTETEKENIHSAGLLMIYMQALRFLADYHNGDVYYQTRYPTQNFDRAINQFGLLRSLEDFLNQRFGFSIPVKKQAE